MATYKKLDNNWGGGGGGWMQWVTDGDQSSFRTSLPKSYKQLPPSHPFHLKLLLINISAHPTPPGCLIVQRTRI